MNNISYCYHSHTYRCGHASGKDEEYVLAAVKAKIKCYGFSDHVFLPNVYQSYMRGDYNLLDSYISSFNNLKEKYKNAINLHIGFEAEYIPQFVDYYKSLLCSKKIEYLILGQHCFYSGGMMFFYRDINDEKISIIKYTEDLIEGMKTGIFLYVAHPDLFLLSYRHWDSLSKKCSQKIIDAAVKYNIPLEINLAKARNSSKVVIDGTYSFLYPFIPFWKMVAKSKAKVVVGIDAHSPKEVLNPGYWVAEEIEKYTGVHIDYDFTL